MQKREFAVHRLDDVMTLAQSAKPCFQFGIQAPATGLNLLRETQLAELLQSPGKKALTERASAGVGTRYNMLGIGVLDEGMIEPRQTFLIDLSAHRRLDFNIGARTKVQGDDLRRSLAQTAREIVPRDDEIIAPIGLAADDDVTVRVAGVEVIDRDPLEFAAQIYLHLLHQTPGDFLELVILRAVVCRNDETELVAIAVGAIDKGLSIGPVARSVVQFAGRALAGHTIALDVAQVCACAVELAFEPDDARFDYNATGADSKPASEHARCSRTPAMVFAGKLPLRFCYATSRTRDALQDLLEIAPLGAAGLSAYASELWFEIVVTRHGGRYQAFRQDMGVSTAATMRRPKYAVGRN
jgi:hypothetical protein